MSPRFAAGWMDMAAAVSLRNSEFNKACCLRNQNGREKHAGFEGNVIACKSSTDGICALLRFVRAVACATMASALHLRLLQSPTNRSTLQIQCKQTSPVDMPVERETIGAF